MPQDNPRNISDAIKLLRAGPRKWLVTGAAGFIGSHIVQFLLEHDQIVSGLDNFLTGSRTNLEHIRRSLPETSWRNFTFHESDIRDANACESACSGVDFVLHQAAVGSVPRSIDAPLLSNSVNVTGFLNMLLAAKNNKCIRFVYAASSSTYGDETTLPKVESRIGRPLSPYAVTKYVNELYAHVFFHTYGLNCIGLRYFNVFGPRQDPNGAYAAVIPRWINARLSENPVHLYGDGTTSRDFCYIDNAVEANILAALTKEASALNEVYNVAAGQTTTLNTLLDNITSYTMSRYKCHPAPVISHEFRPGDVRHSLANIEKASDLLGYSPRHTVASALHSTIDWYATNGAEHPQRTQ